MPVANKTRPTTTDSNENENKQENFNEDEAQTVIYLVSKETGHPMRVAKAIFLWQTGENKFFRVNFWEFSPVPRIFSSYFVAFEPSNRKITVR